MVSRPCQWCLEPIPSPAKARRYCSETCRRAAGKARSVDLLKTPEPDDAVALRYESGALGFMRHALAPDGMPDTWSRRPALCGAWARTSRLVFSVFDPEACAHCVAAALRHPPRRQVDAGADLARLTALLVRWNGHDAIGLVTKLQSFVGVEPGSVGVPAELDPLDDVVE